MRTDASAAGQAADRRHYELLERSADYFQRYLWGAPEARPAREMLAARGLSEQVLRAYGVGYAPANTHAILRCAQRTGFTAADCVEVGMARLLPSGDVRDAFSGRITFPMIDDRGRAVGFGARALSDEQRPKYLNTQAGPIFSKGELLFGAALAAPEARRVEKVVLCEGYLDVIAMRQAGVKNAVCSMGTAVTHQQHRALARMTPAITLALDADPAGHDAALRAGRAAAATGQQVAVARLPEGTDPCDLLRDSGAQALRDVMASSDPLAAFEVERALSQFALTAAESHDSTRGAEAKDRLIAELRPALAELGPGARRDQLIAQIGERIDVDPARVDVYLDLSGQDLERGHQLDHRSLASH